MTDKLGSLRDGSTISLNNKKARNVLNFTVGRDYINNQIKKNGQSFSSSEYLNVKKMISMRKNYLG